MIYKKRCEYCNKLVVVDHELELDSAKVITFTCGHSVVEAKVGAEVVNKEGKIFGESEFCAKHQRNCITKLVSGQEFSSLTGKHLIPFQGKGVEFAYKSNIQCLIADEMGLGKTAQGLVVLALDKDNLLPAIFICKAIATTNWLLETMDWLKVAPQIISSSKQVCFEQFSVHIISFDSLARMKDNESFHKICERAKSVIIDESHLIKNNQAKRTVALKKVIFNQFAEDSKPIGNVPVSIPFEEIEVEHKIEKKVIGLSGTPIKNNATEYFTILNILHPERFSSLVGFCRSYVETYHDFRSNSWKYGGLKDPEFFKEVTKDYIIRRTMDEVMPEIPKVWRQFKYVDLEEKIQAIYDQEWKEFCDFYEQNEGKKDLEFYSNVMAKMARLRHLTGLAKINFCLDQLMEFLGSTERKIVVFTHHKDVMSTLKTRLDEICRELDLELAYTLSSDIQNRQGLLDEFAASKSRVLIASTLAAGESINMHEFCADVIMHERQWNPSNEDQAGSGRFRRIGQKADKIRLDYLVAVGTIDEYFAELVERKRQIFEEAMTGEKSDIPWNESSLIQELAEILAQKGKQKWSIESV